MKKTSRYLLKSSALAGLFLIQSGIAIAQQSQADSKLEHNRAYVSGAIGVTNLFNSSARVDFGPSLSTPVNYDLQPGFNWAVAAGYQYKHFRIEAEFQQLYAGSSTAMVGRIEAPVSGSMLFNVGFVNAYGLWWFTDQFKAFLGGGIGYASASSPTINLTRGCRCSLQGDGDGFAWQLRAGLEYNITDDLRVFGQYSWVGLPSATSGGGSPSLSYSKLQMGTAAIGVRWAF